MKAQTAKVLAKGQVTLPQEVREDLGVRVGGGIVFHEEDGVWRIERQPAGLVEFMRSLGNASKAVTDEDLVAMDASAREAEALDEDRHGL